MDLFEEYLNKKDSYLIKRALTDKSYKKVYQRENGKELPENMVNFELATYGDAILKMGLMSILIKYDRPKPTEAKKDYESDAALVKYIARKYDILKYMLYDKESITIEDYDYELHYNMTTDGKKGRNHCKFIATAVEAVVAAIYEETQDINELNKLFEKWIQYIDSIKESVV